MEPTGRVDLGYHLPRQRHHAARVAVDAIYGESFDAHPWMILSWLTGAYSSSVIGAMSWIPSESGKSK
ncbi:MAG: hypothetical protein WC935_07265 [Thermoleophilia bacterium]